MIKRPGVQFVAATPNETVVSLLNHEGVLYLATNRWLYRLEGRELHRVELHQPKLFLVEDDEDGSL